MTWGLILTAFGLGLRHGIDWDHIAAITDLSTTAPDRRRGFVLSMIYSLGHSVMVLVLGGVAIVVGTKIPTGLDDWMGRVVGFTLVVLGVWMIVSLIRNGRDFRLRSRWMLILSGTFAGVRKVRNRGAVRQIEVQHEHEHEHDHEHGHGPALGHLGHVDPDADLDPAHDHSHQRQEERVNALVADPVPVEVGPDSGRSPGGLAPSLPHHSHPHSHSHGHRHRLAVPDIATGTGRGSAAGIGMLHGIGIESPSQIAIFVASTSVAGVAAGFALLVSWIVGLTMANAGLALAAGAGVLAVERSFRIYATVAVIIALLSIAMGVTYIVGLDVLPAI